MNQLNFETTAGSTSDLTGLLGESISTAISNKMKIQFLENAVEVSVDSVIINVGRGEGMAKGSMIKALVSAIQHCDSKIKTLSYEPPRKCPVCHGTGIHPDGFNCHICEGLGTFGEV